MDSVRMKFCSSPVVTGTPGLAQQAVSKQTAQPTQSFEAVFQQELARANDTGVSFSKHAAQRAQQRSIDLSEASMARLNEGVRLAGMKGLNDTLILVDKTAFLVNVPNNTVITAVNGNELDGNVFTNIDGTVVM